MKWSSEAKRFVTADDEIDYSKLSFSFDDGKSGELWDWLEHDIEGFDGWIYSVPNYQNAITDVYLDTLQAFYRSSCLIKEETVPHNVDGSYKVAVYYDGICLASQTRIKKACINKAIQLFQTYNGEEYVQAKMAANPSWLPPDCVDEWQADTFSYYGCQNGVHLETSIIRYYYPGYKMRVEEWAPSNPDPNLISGKQVDPNTGQSYFTSYAVRYKEHGWNDYGAVHVFYSYLVPGTDNIWSACAGTGAYYNPDKVALSFCDDFYTLIYQ